MKQQDAINRDKLAAQRNKLANERTILAYVRTALAFIAFGAIIIKLIPERDYIIMGYFSLFFAIIFIFLGIRSYSRHKKKIFFSLGA